jgi:ribosomal protein S18 acetylase RimI-like enzyme
MVNVRIRTCLDSELDAVLALWREAAAFATATDDRDGLLALHGRDADALLVAEDAGRIIGSVIAGWDGWRGGIYRLVVAESHRRRGVARTLVRKAVAALEARGVRRIAAVVDADDKQAMAFWRALAADGFFHDAERTRFTRSRDVRAPGSA